MNDINLRKLLMKIGISANIQGFYFILEAINILGKQKIHTKTTFLYEMICKKYGKSASSVERAIRHAVTKAYKQNDILKQIYSTIPDNSVFLYDLTFNFDIFEEIIGG